MEKLGDLVTGEQGFVFRSEDISNMLSVFRYDLKTKVFQKIFISWPFAKDLLVIKVSGFFGQEIQLSQPNNNRNTNNKTTITIVGLRQSNRWEYHPPTPTTHQELKTT